MSGFKRPVSVLVVIHTPDFHVLLLERAAHPGFWQSVTGSQEDDEQAIETAQREVGEETGIAPLGDVTLVTAPYRREGQVMGVLGVIGPTRMAYERVIPLVEATASALGEAMGGQG